MGKGGSMGGLETTDEVVLVFMGRETNPSSYGGFQPSHLILIGSLE
jgi:hypothetical protein